MADYDQIMKALRNAHAAGDTAAATRLAAMAKAAKGGASGFGGGATAGGGSERQIEGAGWDVAKSAGAGLARGTAGLLGLPGTLGDLGGRAIVGAINAATDGDMTYGPESKMSGGALSKALGAATGGATDYQPSTTAGKYAGTVGEFLPGAAAMGGMSPGNLARFGVVPGVASEAAGQATEGTAAEPFARAAAAMAAPVAVGALEKGIRSVISPYGGADPERLKLAKVLDDYGVPITAGQRVGSETLRRTEAATGRGQAITGDQGEAFTSAVLKTAGINSKRATADVLDDAAKRIGAVFDDVVSGVDVTPDAPSLTKMSAALKVYRDLTPKGSAPPIFENINREMVKSFRSGAAVPASTVKTWRSTVSKLTRSPDAATREAAIGMMDAIDDTINAGLVAAGKPEAIAKLATARGEYRNLLAIEKAASGAGEGAATGILSPSAVRNAVVVQGRGSYAKGRRGEIADIARAGEAILKPLPRPGTAGELAALGVPGGIGIGVGSGIGASLAGPTGAAIGGVAGALLPPALRAAKAGPLQSYLANQLVNPGGSAFDPRLMGALPGLLSQGNK